MLPLLLLFACTPDDAALTDTDISDSEVPVGEDYDFTSRFSEESSVSYSGQVFRHVLVQELINHIEELTSRLDSGWFPEAGEVEGELEFYMAFDSETSGSVSLSIECDPVCAQSTFDEVSSGKDLWGKLAGNDPVGQHRDWSAGIDGIDGSPTPQALLEDWFAQLDAQALDWSNGTMPLDPDGNPVGEVYVTAEGLDLAEMTHKFLLGALAFSQASDDYLDDDTDGKGLLSDHTVAEEGKPYTALEHSWDEGFGYFGAARDLADWSDAEIAGDGQRDSWEADGRIDLLTEVTWGHARYAGKRDAGAVVTTDFSGDAFEAFRAGRQLLADADGALSDDELDTLAGHRDEVLFAWESVIGASVVHYLNATLQDMRAIGTDEYDFSVHAKHFSEAKALALSMQFNPHSAMSADDFATLHALLGDAPVLEGEALTAYAEDLRAARTLLGDVYGFDTTNLGDDDGNDGW